MKALLFAVPMLVYSLSGQAGDYEIEFITLMAARGEGIFQLEAKTEPNYAYHVKIGNADPVELMCTDRQTLSIPYNVDQDTFIYMVDNNINAVDIVDVLNIE